MTNATTRRLTALTFALCTLLLLLSPTFAWQPNKQYHGAGRRIRMSDIRTLTFYNDRRTAYRRTSPLPQLTCVGTPCSRYQPDVVQCQAMGDGQWKCTADLPSTMRMGRVEVSCEGYDFAEDEWVLKDSCALTYHLLPSGRSHDDPWRAYSRRSGWGERVLEGLFQVAFWGIFAVIVIGFIRAVRGNTTGIGSGGGGGGGGGGWWPGEGGFHPHQPPPPYTPKPDPDGASWRPGFWTGLGLGGLAATAAASSRRRPQSTFYQPPQAGLFDNDHGFGARGRGWDDDDRGIGSSSSFMRESTGFGGTRNR